MSRGCEDIRERLVEFIEGELDPVDAAEVAEHLASCRACAEEHEALEGTFALLKDDGYVEPDTFYWTRFNAKLRQRLRASGGLNAAPRWTVLVPRLVPVGVAALFFLVGLSVGLGPMRGGGDVAQDDSSFAPTQTASYKPVVSPRSKRLVESGTFSSPIVNAADTLVPENYDSYMEEPRMILASSESHPQDLTIDADEMEQLLRERLRRSTNDE